MSRTYTLSIIPKGRLYLILVGLLINSIIFSSAFTFFDSFNAFSDNFLGESEETFVIYNQLANTVFTGTVPTYLARLISEIPGVDASPEVLVASLTIDGEILTLRGVSEEFFELQELEKVDGENVPSMGECLLGIRAYKRIGKEIGEYITLRSTQEPVLYEFRVTGVYRSNSPLDDEVIVPIDYARSMNGLPLESSTLIRVKLAEGAISQESLREMVSEIHTIFVDVGSDTSFKSKLLVKTESGRVIETVAFTAPGGFNVSLPFGRYILDVEGIEKEIVLDGDKNVDFQLKWNMNLVRFKVYNATSGESLETIVYIENDNLEQTISPLGSGITEALLPDGVYHVSASHLGFSFSHLIEIMDDIEIEIPLGLVPLNIIIYDEQNEPIKDALVTVEGNQRTLSILSDSMGKAEFQLEPGEYLVTAEVDGYIESRSLTLRMEQTLLLTIGAEAPSHDLTVKVSWSNGTYVNEAHITIIKGDLIWNIITDHRGIIKVSNIPDGLLQISAEKNNKRSTRELSLNQDIVTEITLPVSIKFDPYKISPEWVRYLPQSITVTLSDAMLQNAMRVLVSLLTSTLLILAILFTTATMINSLDIIQNSVKESSNSLGVLRSVGATKLDSARIIGTGITLFSAITGLLGYVIGYLLLSAASNSGLLSLAGYILTPRFNIVLLASSIILSPVITIIGLYKQLGDLFQYSPMTLLQGLRRSDILYLPTYIRFPVAAFTIPLLVRAIPEILVGPYSIGYDTISAYIPSLVALQTGFESQVYDFLYQRPFFWVVASLPYPLDDLSPFKFLPVILHGLLGLSIYFYAEEATDDKHKALAVALLSTIYFIALRVSWDLFGNEMGLILVFTSLTLIRRGLESWSSRGLAATAVIATVLTHEAASMILFAASIPSIISSVKMKKHRDTLNLLLILIPAFIFFIYRIQVLDFPLISNPASFRYPSQTYESLFKSVSTLYLYVVLPLIPFAIVGLNSAKKSLAMVYWYVGASIAALSPLVSPDAAIAFWDRWAYMTVYPLCFFAVEGIYSLKRVKINYSFDRPRATDLSKLAGGTLMIAVLLISSSFIAATPGGYQPYHTLFGSESLWIVRFVPSSMLLSTVPASWAEEAIAGVEWLNDNLTEVSVLLVDEELRGYAALHIDQNKVLLRDLGEPWYSNPNYVEDAAAAGEDFSGLGYDVFLLSRHFDVPGYDTLFEGSYLRVSKYR